MAKTNDSMFKSEFDAMMQGRRSLNVPIRLKDLPIPKVAVPKLGQPKGHFVFIDGVEEKFFDKLNKTVATLEGRKALQKPIVLSDGTYKKKADGSYEYEDVTVPLTHVAVCSPHSIKLRRFVDQNGKQVEHKIQDGFKYVSFSEENGKRSYVYILPKSCVYRLNVCALVLSFTPRRKFYEGYKIALQNGTYLYMYVLPYKYRAVDDSLVVRLKPSANFTEEIKNVMIQLYRKKYVFNKTLTELETHAKGLKNLGFIETASTIVDDFEALSSRLDDKEAVRNPDEYSYDI